MADLTEIQSSQAVKIIGSDATGTETTPVGANSQGELFVTDTIRVGGIEGAISVSTTAVEAKVGASLYSGRTSLTVYNNGTATIYWGFTNAVTSSTGTPFFKNQQLVFSIEGTASIWLIAASGTHNIRVTESK
jgi:hypothetical protein